MKKKIWLIGAICGAVLIAAAVTVFLLFQDQWFRVPTKETYGFINPEETKAPVDTGMKVDGVLDETVYKDNTWTYLHHANGTNTVDIAMTSWFGEQGLYFAYEVRESTPIYVNMDRATWMNSCIEMYLVPGNVQKLPSENIFEIDLLPTGYLLFKRPNAAGGWSDVSTTHDTMAYLGAVPYGGEVNTEACKGYDLELFIPYDYLAYLGVDTQDIKDGHVNVNPCHITSYNETGTDGSVDRYWYSFAKQLGGDGWNDVNRYYQFNKDGAMGTMPNVFVQGEHYTITGKPNAIPGQKTTVKVTADAGYAISSITCNGQEQIRYVDYAQDGSVTLTMTAANEGMTFTAAVEPVTGGNKTISGKVELQNIFGDTYEGVSASYEDASGQHKLELAEDGSFRLENMPQGYYLIRAKKNGYVQAERSLYVNRDMDVAVPLTYELFETESGNCWYTDTANTGNLTKINGTGAILTKDPLADFYVEANFFYSQTLSQEFVGDDYQQQRMGIRVKFEDGKYWHIDLLKQNDGNYVLQFGKILGEQSLYNWDIVHTLRPEQIAAYESNAGIKLGILRLGKTAYLYLDNCLVATTQLPTNAKAQVGFESFVSNAKVMQIPYRLTVNGLKTVELVDGGSQGAKVSLQSAYTLGQTVVIKITPTATGKLLSLQVNGVEYAQDAQKQNGGYVLTIANNQEKILSVKALYADPTLTTGVVDTLDTNADGVSLRLVQDGQAKATAIVGNGKAVFTNVHTGVYEVQAQIFNVWTTIKWVTILDDQPVTADIKTLFENTDHIHYADDIDFSGKQGGNYSIATDITGDAWFTMQLQVPKAQLDAVAANKGNVRLGYRLFFGGEKGNYEWENEYELTLKYTQEGTWLFEQMNTWISQPVPQALVDALTQKGLYMALHRNGETGVLTLYCGATTEELLSGVYAFRWDSALEKQKQPIMRFGVGFWSEKGSDYKAKVSNLSYTTQLEGIVPLVETDMTLELLGHKNGSYVNLPAGTEVFLQAEGRSYTMTVDAQSRLTGKIWADSYTVTVDGYTVAKLEVSKGVMDSQLILEYQRFTNPTGWDTEKHDLSKVNESDPVISMTGGTMNVLTRDTYGDVAASIYVKADNSTHSAHTQGIWIRFADGKYMVLYQEDEKLLYADRLWDFETVTGQWQQIASLPEQTMNKWYGDGYWLTLSRKDNTLCVTANGQLYQVTVLPEEYADDRVQIGFFAYDSAPDASWQFAITDRLPAYTVTCLSGEHGTVAADKTTVQLGQTITLQITPDDGYCLKSLLVNGVEYSHQVVQGNLALPVGSDMTVEATFAPVKEDVTITANIPVANGTAIRLQKDGQDHTATFAEGTVIFQGLTDGKYNVQIQVFGYWADLKEVELVKGATVQLDVASLFESAEMVNFDGNVSFQGTSGKHYSVAANITGDAWFTMQLQVPKAQLDAVAANKGNVRLGYRLFFGGESGNYQWENEYEPTLKYTADGRWVIEQMNTWEGWDNYLSDDMVNALTGEGLYLALHRDAQTGALTLYYGATAEELLSCAHSLQWTSAAEKQKQPITRFGVGFWSENGSDYTATVNNLRYGTSLDQLLEAVNMTLKADVDVPVRLTQNGQQKAVGAVKDGEAVLYVSQQGNYQVEVKIFNAWCPVATVTADGEQAAYVDVLSVFEDREFADIDGNISFAGTQNKHCSVATDIAGDAWFAMQVQVPKAQLDAIAANRGNVRLGYRLFFGGAPGNYLWENEYEITLKYTQNGWIMEQMNTWEGWDRTLTQAMVDALTGDGLYLALHRDSKTGVLTVYYGATQAELLAGSHSYTYTQAFEKHKENITRFGAGFWSENGSDYTAVVTGLRYGATLEEALDLQ